MCTSPMIGWRTAAGDIVFVERMGKDVVCEVQFACKQCMECRLAKSRHWAMRCMHEMSLHEQNAFITLTYDDEHYPNRGDLCYRDFQLFMKRLRKVLGHEVRYYMCGEYGELTGRPHFHAILFGEMFDDREHYKTTEQGMRLYTSPLLQRVWQRGFCPIGDVTFESAAYVARYCVQKVTGNLAKYHYARSTDPNFGPVFNWQLTPEFNKMSLKPGIGARWLEKFKTDVYPHDYVVINGKKVTPPKYYDKVFKRENEDEFEQIVFAREKKGRANWPDNTPDRNRVRDVIVKARAKMLIRNLE